MLNGTERVPPSAVEVWTNWPPDALALFAVDMGETRLPFSASRKIVEMEAEPTVTLKVFVTELFCDWPSLTVTVMTTVPLAWARGVRSSFQSNRD